MKNKETRLHTASQVIRLSDSLENRLADLYEDMSKKYLDEEATLFSLAKENRSNASQIRRTYQEVITDAIEGCFAFDMESDDYMFEIATAPADETYLEFLKKVLAMEEKMFGLYTVAAEQSMTSLADVSRALTLLAKKKSGRIQLLRSLVMR
jgi:hypothetical protein